MWGHGHFNYSGSIMSWIHVTKDDSIEVRDYINDDVLDELTDY